MTLIILATLFHPGGVVIVQVAYAKSTVGPVYQPNTVVTAAPPLTKPEC